MSHQPSDIITPKALLLDERLTPLERNAWLTFRALAGSDGTVVLSYDALRGYLPSAPGSKRAAPRRTSRNWPVATDSNATARAITTEPSLHGPAPKACTFSPHR
ncbi:MAG: hypothetical protein LCH72_14565, partial [Proteobacteria bacterium]|nr:hypothetical protein [Pseudomonadota bacterium]